MGDHFAVGTGDQAGVEIAGRVVRAFISPYKTTVEVPDELCRKAKSVAALRGRKLKDLIEEGLRLVLKAPHGGTRRRGLSELMEEARGVIDSGCPISLRTHGTSRVSAAMPAIVDTGPLVAFLTVQSGTMAGSPRVSKNSKRLSWSANRS